MLAGVEDVELLVGSIDPGEHPRVGRLLEEAGDVVEAFCRRQFGAGQVPVPVTRVVARMVARALAAESAAVGLPVGTSNVQSTAGPFSRSVSLAEGSTDGGVWLSRQDRIKLRPFTGGAFSVRTW